MEQQSCDDRENHERLGFNPYFRHDTTEEGPAGEWRSNFPSKSGFEHCLAPVVEAGIRCFL